MIDPLKLIAALSDPALLAQLKADVADVEAVVASLSKIVADVEAILARIKGLSL